MDLKPVNAFYDIPAQQSQQQQSTPSGSNGTLQDLASFSVGTGQDAYYVDKQGIWLGNTNFAKAPFSVDMQGQMNAKNATFTDENGKTIIDGNGLVSTNGFQSGSYYDTSGVTITGNFTNTTVIGSQLTFTLQRQANVFLSFFAFTSLSLVSSFRDYYIQVAMMLDGVVYPEFAQFKFNSSSMANQTIGATLSFGKPYLITAGTHVLYLVWSAFTDTSAFLGTRGMNYLVLGT